MYPFRKLAVWQLSRAALVQVYKLTKQFPRDERFGITAQVRRAAVSVLCDITEGSKRVSPKDFAHFINMAEGSAAEAAILLEVSVDLELASAEPCRLLVAEYERLSRMLFALRRKLVPRRD